ncbi:MAG: hypothetical protein NT118_14400 [Lentisphaerae bacterium]|nr:hypothetical protein [Lentisphaerota bacterium]
MSRKTTTRIGVAPCAGMSFDGVHRVVEAIDLDKYIWEFRWEGIRSKRKSRLSLLAELKYKIDSQFKNSEFSEF